MTINKIWGHCQREWGYEVRVDFVDEYGSVFNECISFPSLPSQAEIDAKIEETRQRLIAQMQPIPEQLFGYEVKNEDGTTTVI